jgi:hypothetical protein
VSLRAVAATALAVAAVTPLAACGAAARAVQDAALSPVAVVRAWSDAINHDLDEQAAEFFAPGARVYQRGRLLVLWTKRAATDFDASLPCQGRIVAIGQEADTVTATFLLDNRGTFACGGVGSVDTVRFVVRDGKIAVMHLLRD